MYLLASIQKPLLVFFLLFISLHANQTSKIVLISLGDGILIPIQFYSTPVVSLPPVKVSVSKPTLNTALPKQTDETSINIEIKGQANAKVYVNGNYYGVLDSRGTLILSLNTSGDNGIKNFTIFLQDNAGTRSDTLTVSITKVTNPKFDMSYKSLYFYKQNKGIQDYVLSPLDDSKFDTLNSQEKELSTPPK